MNHRIFIAINLPKELKEKLCSYRNYWPEVPARWVKPENLHLTLVFLGYIKEKDLIKILEATEKTASEHKIFSIDFNKICYGPPQKSSPLTKESSEDYLFKGNKLPRLIWVEGNLNKNLIALRNDLEKKLEDGNISFLKENREFKPHITLARINTWEFKKLEPEERPEINEKIELKFEVKSIEVMESKLKRGGAEYAILKSAKLNKF